MKKYIIYTTNKKENIHRYYAGYNGFFGFKKQVVEMDLGGYAPDEYIGEKFGKEYIVAIEEA